jgi:hypothetical protein
MNKYLVKLAKNKGTDNNVAERTGKTLLSGYVATKLTHPFSESSGRKADRAATAFSPNISQDTIKHMRDKSGIKKLYDSRDKKFKKTKAYGSSFYIEKGRKPPRIYAAGKTEAVHEFGHAISNKNKLNRFKNSTGVHAGTNLAAAGLLVSGDKDKAKYAPAVAALGSLNVISEEVNANRHAYKALRKMQGEPVANRFLKKVVTHQVGHHAIRSAALPVAAYAAYKWIYGKKKNATEKR